jgi:hypothetical protein
MGRRGRVLLVACLFFARPVAAQTPSSGPSAFAETIARLSEPPGTFDSDNLISNERSYLAVVPEMAERAIRGGAYIGVGPDQNFTYIARIRPSIAYIVDIRRENLLLHLLFKALFAEARTRAEYLCLLTGRRFPVGTERWKTATIGELVAHVDESAHWPEDDENLWERVEARLSGFGVPLSLADLAAIRRFHRAFMVEGLDLVYSGRGASERQYYPASDYPTLRELLTSRAPDGRQWHYLASEDDFAFLKDMEARNAIVPIVGDVSGSHAFRSVAAAISERGERVSAFYISNVETYLEQNMASGRFLDNLSRLPRTIESVMIRSTFDGASSTSTLKPIDQLLMDASRNRR